MKVELTAEMIVAKKAKVSIPEEVTLNKDDQVTVQLVDKAGNTSDVIEKTVKEKEFDKEKIVKIEIKTPRGSDNGKVHVNSSLPKTGDTANLSMFAGIIGMAGSLLALIGFKKRKKEDEQE